MFNFVDELVLESFSVPWLIIWIIQLLVFLLFLALLFCFTIVTSDHTTADSPPTLHSTTSVFTLNTNPLQVTRGLERLSIKGEIQPKTSTEIVRVREGISEREASSLYFLHPCYYFKLARVVFLKCFGLDSISESDQNPSTQKHRGKKKES